MYLLPSIQDLSGSHPVMVFIHAGGFQIGTGIEVPGYFLAARDVVVVTINYRLGNFGKRRN